MLPVYGTNTFRHLVDELRLVVNRVKLKEEDVTVLERSFPYYSRLSDRHKKEFRGKLERILTLKKFIGRAGLRATSEMRLLIGATIVMVTFGWNDLCLVHFDKILLYPNSYYSTISKEYHRGEVNPKFGIIVLSWSCFVSGLQQEFDGVNLGIHEIAHALKLENQIHYNGESDFFNPKVYESFRKLADEEIFRVNTGNSTVFRANGGLNNDEFFAVALETFFEKPHGFYAHNPALYNTVVQLMRQDPRVWIRS